jgi:TPR repeat protein
VVVFIGLNVAKGVGDEHPGHRVPFWQQACVAGAPNGCSNLAQILGTYCRDGSGWACNELGVLHWYGRVQPAGFASDIFARACQLQFEPACTSVLMSARGVPPRQAPPRLVDYPVVLRKGKGAIPQKTPVELYEEACRQQWGAGCLSLGNLYVKGDGVARDAAKAANAYERACNARLGQACSNLGLMYFTGDGIAADRDRGLALLKRSCELGFQPGCRWLKDPTPAKPNVFTEPDGK